MRTGVVQRPKDKILSMSPQEITYEMVGKKLVEIAMARGKTTRIDRQEQVRRVALHSLQECLEHHPTVMTRLFSVIPGR